MFSLLCGNCFSHLYYCNDYQEGTAANNIQMGGQLPLLKHHRIPNVIPPRKLSQQRPQLPLIKLRNIRNSLQSICILIEPLSLMELLYFTNPLSIHTEDECSRMDEDLRRDFSHYY